jgi:membrane protease YdiL (CAAX protease family)
MKKKEVNSKKVSLVTPIVYFIYLFLVWSFYRMNFKFSETLEELYIKPIIWLLPFLYILPKDRIRFSDLGITYKNLFPSAYLSIALGIFFALLGFVSNMSKYGGINFGANIGSRLLVSAIMLSFATSITEEFVFRGYLLGVFLRKYKTEFIPVLLTTVIWTAVHVPVTYFVWGMDGIQMFVYLTLTFIYGLGASIIFIRTRNIAAPMLLHVLWEWPIILFR